MTPPRVRLNRSKRVAKDELLRRAETWFFSTLCLPSNVIFFIIHGKLSFAFFFLIPARVVHSDGLVRFPLCARALTPPFELFVNAILSSHEVMRFLLARRESPCNKNSSSNSMVHNKSLFLLAFRARKELVRTNLPNEEEDRARWEGKIDGRRRERGCWIHAIEGDLSSILHVGSWGVGWFISGTTRNAMNGFMQPCGNARNFQLGSALVYPVTSVLTMEIKCSHVPRHDVNVSSKSNIHDKWQEEHLQKSIQLRQQSNRSKVKDCSETKNFDQAHENLWISTDIENFTVIYTDVQRNCVV